MGSDRGILTSIDMTQWEKRDNLVAERQRSGFEPPAVSELARASRSTPSRLLELITVSVALIRQDSMQRDFAAYLYSLQESVIAAVEALEAEATPQTGLLRSRPSVKFVRDEWTREDGGERGTSCVISGGSVFEKGGVYVSVSSGR